MQLKLLKNPKFDFCSFMKGAYAVEHAGATLDGHEYFEFLARSLEPFADGQPGQIIVNLPPRHLKTFLAAVGLIAWEFGHRPRARVLVIGGSDRLANSILKRLRSLMSSEWYESMFSTRFSRSDRKTELVTTAGGTVLCSSIFGNFTGFGGDLIVVDDAADIAKATDARALDEINEIFDQKVMSRRNHPAKARVIEIAHRLAEDDLSGHLLAEGGWQHVCLPLVAERDECLKVGKFTWYREAGELLRPNLYSDAKLEQLKMKSAPPGFEALQQQNPAGRPFASLDADCIGVHSGGDSDRFPIILSVDPAQIVGSRTSFSVAQVWAVGDGCYVLKYQLREKFDYQALRHALIHLCKRFLPSIVLIENNGFAQALAGSLRKAGFGVELVDVGRKTKIERFAEHLPLFRKRAITVAIDLAYPDTFIEELMAFPNGEFDDQVDALTQLLAYVKKTPNLPAKRSRAIGVIRRY